MKRTLIATVVAASLVSSCALPRSAHALTVFDPANYSQNILTALRNLDQINNQVRQLQNQAQRILQAGRNLERLPQSVRPDLTRVLGDLQTQLRRGEAIALDVRQTDAALKRLFPKQFPKAIKNDALLKDARARWDESHASFERAARVQAEIASAVAKDQARLDTLVRQSQSAVGSLQALQAGNQLSALNVKQAMQLQTLMAANARARSVERARALLGEAEARQRLETFLGGGKAYTRN